MELDEWICEHAFLLGVDLTLYLRKIGVPQERLEDSLGEILTIVKKWSDAHEKRCNHLRLGDPSP